MKKKVLQELIENAKQNEKYIYQRYNGIITKYIDDGDYYIGCNTGIAIEKNEHLLLGKVSENIIDLIEVEDVIKYRIYNISTTLETKGYVEGIIDISDEEMLQKIKSDKNYHILEILTKEQYMANCYKVGGEDE